MVTSDAYGEGAFVASMGLMVVVAVAAGIAFGTTCFVGFWGGGGLRSLWPLQPFEEVAWGTFAGGGLGTLAAVLAIEGANTSLRDDLNHTAPRVLGVLKPIEVELAT